MTSSLIDRSHILDTVRDKSGDIIVSLRSEVQWASVCVGHWGGEPREDVGQQNSNQLWR